MEPGMTMMNLRDIIQVGLIVFLACIGAVVWFTRLEGKVSVLERVFRDHQELVERTALQRKELMAEISAHIMRIEGKLDALTARYHMENRP